jgi:hypothetical protein
VELLTFEKSLSSFCTSSSRASGASSFRACAAHFCASAKVAAKYSRLCSGEGGEATRGWAECDQEWACAESESGCIAKRAGSILSRVYFELGLF